MGTLVIVKHEVLLQALVSLVKRFIGFRIHLLIFGRRPEPFDQDIVMRPPPTSILIRIPAGAKRPVKAKLVNWVP